MRYASVDILRGFTVAVMILVNNPGSWEHMYPCLSHAEWHGCTLADFVFPFFLFIVGLSIVFALSKALDSGADKRKLALKSLKRASILIGLGLFLNLFPEFDFISLRFPGVLQRIGIVFGIAAVLFIYCSEQQRRWGMLLILMGYWLLMAFVPLPGMSEASLEKNQNWAAWLDQLLLDGHMWKYSLTWDPEGVLSTFPALVSTLLGVSAGLFMKQNNDPVKGLLLGGIFGVLIGFAWSFIFPMNKALWTSSYVLFTGGVALVLLALAVYAFDRHKITTGTIPFRALGANPLAVYFGSEIMAKIVGHVQINDFSISYWYYEFFAGFLSPVLASLSAALGMVIFWSLIAMVLYKRKIFIKI